MSALTGPKKLRQGRERMFQDTLMMYALASPRLQQPVMHVISEEMPFLGEPGRSTRGQRTPSMDPY